jgi:hypothetical protein
MNKTTKTASTSPLPGIATMSNPNPIPAILFLAACLTFAPNAPAEPQIFSDDFQTATTYNYDSLVNSCTTTEKPKWSIVNIIDGLPYDERLVSGGGRLLLSNWRFLSHNSGTVSNLHRMEAAYVGRTGSFCDSSNPYVPTPEPGSGVSNLAFTHDDLCILGGFQFNRFQQATQNLPRATGPVNPFDLNPDMHWGLQYGPDGAPGIAGMDDDGDGSTDNDPNCDYGLDGCPGDCNFDDDGNGVVDDAGDTFGVLDGNPIGCNQNNDQGTDDSLFTSASSFQRVAEYLATGPDGCPGNCGVDDDGNGITDVTDVPTFHETGIDDDSDGTTDEFGELGAPQPDLTELGWPSSDDSDDIPGEQGFFITMRAFNVAGPTAGGRFVGVVVNPPNPDHQFALVNSTSGYTYTFEDEADEIGPGFYAKDTRYNYTFCAEGSSYGAQLWIGDDMANPVETLGPKLITGHGNKSSDFSVAIVSFQDQHGIFTPIQNFEIRGNQNFCDSFWVVENATLSSLPDELLDPDGDALPNHCDLCDEVFNPVHDAVFDCNDFAFFAACFNKAGNPPRGGCSPEQIAAYHADHDNDIDGVDFAKFAQCFNGAGNPPRATGCPQN